MITHRTLGVLNSLVTIEKALRDLEVERQQIVTALNILLGASPVGEFRVPITDDTGTPAMYKLVAGAGVTITINAGAQTCTISSP